VKRLAEAGRKYWRGVLVAGGLTAIPRWTLNPVTGIVEHGTKISDELVAALCRLADELAVPLTTVRWQRSPRVYNAGMSFNPNNLCAFW